MAQSSSPLPRRACSNHPDRPAIGVCVMLATPICSECSTRYEGVNYSKEGLRLLHERRAASGKQVTLTARLLYVLAWCAAPLLLYFVYLSYEQTAIAVLTLLHWTGRE